MQHDEFTIHRLGHASAACNQVARFRISTDAYGDSLGELPVSAQLLLRHVIVQCAIHCTRHSLQRHLAQRNQIATPEEVAQSSVDALLGINIAAAHAVHQRLGRQVAQHNLVSAVEHPVWHGLAHGDAGQALHARRNTLHMLNVQRREHIDLGLQNLQHILEALRVRTAFNIGVRQLVDQHHLGMARHDRIYIHLIKQRALVLDLLSRNLLQLRCKLGRARPPMRLHNADYDVFATTPAAHRLA